MNFADFSRFLENYKRKMFVIVNLNGVVSKADCDEVIGVIGRLNFSPAQIRYHSFLNRGTVVPSGTSRLFLSAGHLYYVTSVVLTHYQLVAPSSAPKNEEKVRFAKIIFHAMRRRLPQQLRTTEQLGYTARLSFWNELNSIGFGIFVYTQPTKFTTDHVESRITNFLELFFDKFFKNEKCFQSLVKPYGYRIPVNFADCKRFYAETLLEKGRDFRKLCVHVQGFKPGASNAKLSKDSVGGKPLLQYLAPNKKQTKVEVDDKGKRSVEVIGDIEQFKRSLALLPGNLT